ncbi:uncharacterized protein Z518_01201 [Rhinocladiella mackenziei CBS 650.93]|uniref:Rpr2-domain-containing protein n=1 Tax=Rhinocladiella mackenziei CBS 650.93 TaxID=1442369 RepID=A0A0D2JKY3_9EURO|nr:uncharacterized protein Z518_01201 [Rhinocladiella mackenziei CBS 650.93]KIX10120.1 hypothetical protein Z518_01201 [Rhinocladiella mackenziei CBS 650.93]
MAKAKGSKGSIPQRHLHSRLSYLHQAATFLATADTQKSSAPKNEGVTTHASLAPGIDSQIPSEATRLLAHLRGVSRKSQIRLGPTVKHSICKRCDTLMLPGRTSSEMIVNSSKNGQKPWADIFEVYCTQCGSVKRFPVGMAKGKRENSRPKALVKEEDRRRRDPIPTT